MSDQRRINQMAKQQIHIDRENLRMLKCSNLNCDSTFFTQIFEIGIWSGLINPTGKDQIINMAKMVCIKCGSHPALEEQNDPKGDNTKKEDTKEDNTNESKLIH